MKMLIITCLKEYQATVTELLAEANIHVFSVSATTGFKDDIPESMLHTWFNDKQEKFDSVFVYSFTHQENAYQALDLIKQYNRQYDIANPMRVFILPVEAAGY